MAKETRLNVRIDRDELDLIHQAATEKGVKLSDYVLGAVRARLAGDLSDNQLELNLAQQLRLINERLTKLEGAA